jgi:hypothetical protein
MLGFKQFTNIFKTSGSCVLGHPASSLDSCSSWWPLACTTTFLGRSHRAVFKMFCVWVELRSTAVSTTLCIDCVQKVLNTFVPVVLLSCRGNKLCTQSHFPTSEARAQFCVLHSAIHYETAQ